MPGLSGVPLPTPTSARTLAESNKQLGFLVSQQIVANTSDDITGYLGPAGKIIWMVNHVFLGASR